MPRILVIDDDVQIQVLLHKILDRAGYEVLVASDGKRGLKICESTQVDLATRISSCLKWKGWL